MTDSADNVLFPTMVVGSLPRPQWVRDLIEDRKANRISKGEAEKLLDDAIPSAVRMQERAGLDFLSDGEWRRESYVKVFAEAVDGFGVDLLKAPSPMDTGLPYPAVISRLVRKRAIAAGEAAFLKKHSDHKAIVAIPSPYTIGRRMWSEEHSSTAYPTREEFMDACIPIVRQEIVELAGLGVEPSSLTIPGWRA